MKIKSYFAKSIETAIQNARQELGPDAMLITSRRAPAENRQYGEYEVVFGIAAADEQRLTPTRPADDLASELKQLRSQLQEIRQQLTSRMPLPDERANGGEVLAELLAADLDGAIARNIVERAETTWKQAAAPLQGLPLLRAIVAEQMREGVQVSEFGASIKSPNKVVVLVGPAGVGKTTSLAKLAIRHCIAKRLSLRIVSVDTHRIGGHGLMRTLSSVMGVGFTGANSFSQLREAVAENSGKDFILVDTPGFSEADRDGASELARILRSLPNCEVHLVLSASMKRADLARTAERFQQFSPSSLLFTKLDETASMGSMISETLRSQLPLSFLSSGTAIPEDLDVPDPRALVDSLLNQESRAAASAA